MSLVLAHCIKNKGDCVILDENMSLWTGGVLSIKIWYIAHLRVYVGSS